MIWLVSRIVGCVCEAGEELGFPCKAGEAVAMLKFVGEAVLNVQKPQCQDLATSFRMNRMNRIKIACETRSKQEPVLDAWYGCFGDATQTLINSKVTQKCKYTSMSTTCKQAFVTF